jgi:hypothetical protein
LHSRHFLVQTETEYTELLPINTGVPQGSVLGPLLYLQYTARPTDYTRNHYSNLIGSTLASDNNPVVASHKLQTNLTAIHNWLQKWRLETSESKSVHVAFTTRRETCPAVHTNNVQLLRKKTSSLLGCTLTGDSPGVNTYT